MPRAVRILVLCLLVVVAGGCGNKVETRTIGETEGLYIDVGELKYQVQISRILNPNEVEDRAYLVGLPAGEAAPTAEEAWFGVFLRVQNTTDKTLAAAGDFEIVDTVENSYEPLELAAGNPWVYRPQALAPRGLIPEPGSPAEQGPIQGSMLLFKLTTETLQNRPLEFKIRSSESPDEEGIIDLDV